MSIEIFPVVHVQDEEQAIEQSALALESGADGVYLIDHHQNTTLNPLFSAFNNVVDTYPDSFVGVNILQQPNAYTAFSMLYHLKNRDSIRKLPNGLWVDNARPWHLRTAELRERYSELKTVQYLGGVSFKYTSDYTEDVAAASRKAVELSPYVDVVTTSGPGTGSPPTVEKIAAMKQTIGDQKLAIASGVSADNINDFMGNFDQLLVASSIETEPYSGIFDVHKLREIINIAHS